MLYRGLEWLSDAVRRILIRRISRRCVSQVLCGDSRKLYVFVFGLVLSKEVVVVHGFGSFCVFADLRRFLVPKILL